MPDGNAALGAARFEITIDGQSLGRFEMVLGVVASGAAPRSLQVHELPLLLKRAGGSQSDRVISWEKTQELRTGKFTPWDHTFEFPDKHFSPSNHDFSSPADSSQAARRSVGIFDITMKRGVCSRALVDRWKALGAHDVVLVGLGPAGQPVARYNLKMAWPRKYSSAVDIPTAGPSKIAGAVLDAKGGGDIAIETIEIAHEGMRLD